MNTSKFCFTIPSSVLFRGFVFSKQRISLRTINLNASVLLILNGMRLFTYLRSWALLKIPPNVQLLKNFQAFYGTRRFITVFIRALQWARSIQSTPSHPISFKCPATYVLVFLVVSFLLAFPSISYMHSSSPPFMLHAFPISSSFTCSF
jgi:hypothetical protein